MKRKIFCTVPVVRKHLEMFLSIDFQMTEGLFHVILLISFSQRVLCMGIKIFNEVRMLNLVFPYKWQIAVHPDDLQSHQLMGHNGHQFPGHKSASDVLIFSLLNRELLDPPQCDSWAYANFTVPSGSGLPATVWGTHSFCSNFLHFLDSFQLYTQTQFSIFISVSCLPHPNGSD